LWTLPGYATDSIACAFGCGHITGPIALLREPDTDRNTGVQPMTDIVLDAMRLAERAHRLRNHLRKAPEGEDRPAYFLHLAEVAWMLQETGLDREVVAAAMAAFRGHEGPGKNSSPAVPGWGLLFMRLRMAYKPRQGTPTPVSRRTRISPGSTLVTGFSPVSSDVGHAQGRQPFGGVVTRMPGEPLHVTEGPTWFGNPLTSGQIRASIGRAAGAGALIGRPRRWRRYGQWGGLPSRSPKRRLR
jgi:hypothetical protein